MKTRLFDSELKVMDVLWDGGELTAGQIAKLLNKRIGWNRNTTYTVINKLVQKGAIVRNEPSFLCKAAISKEEVQLQEAEELLAKFFDGSAELFLSTYIGGKTLSKDEINRLKQLVEDLGS